MSIWEENLATIEQHVAEYMQNYECIFRRRLERGSKPEVLGDKNNRRCRFCRRSAQQATFRKKAHAVPESVGNSALLTWYECDDCNAAFGEGIENDFANWNSLFAAVSAVHGRSGPRTFKRQQWRIGFNNKEDVIQVAVADSAAVRRDEDAAEIHITVPVHTYTPMNVLKTFYKMAIAIMREEELGQFGDLPLWVRSIDRSKRQPAPVFSKVLWTTVPGNGPFESPEVLLVRRTSRDTALPYMSFVLACGNICFQAFLLSVEQTAGTIKGLWCPIPHAIRTKALPHELDLAGDRPVKDETHTVTLKYDPESFAIREGGK